jgi:hypothetical protein
MPSTLTMDGAIAVRKLAERRIPRAMEDRLGLKIFPLGTVNETKLIYERLDLWRGLQYARGVGGTFGRLKRPNVSQLQVDPGHYGDIYQITEADLESLRQIGSWTEFDTQGDHTKRATTWLTERFLDRVEKNIWDICLTGTFEAATEGGTPLMTPVFEIDAATPPTLFNNLSASTPRRWLHEQIIRLNQRGFAVDYSKAIFACNSNTAKMILDNTNAADIGGRRLAPSVTVNSLEEVNSILLSNGIPKITCYDGVWYPEGTGGPNLFIPDGKMVLAGRRKDGEQIGQYRLTKSAFNKNSAPGEFYQVLDYRDTTGDARIDIKMGHNGGPVPLYVEAMSVFNVY